MNRADAVTDSTRGCGTTHAILRLTRTNNLAGKKESWVPEPSRFILMHEPPALSYQDQLYHWHYARGKTTITRTSLKSDTQRFVSAIAFVDGHSAPHDFTQALTINSAYPIEPTSHWIWHKEK